MKTQEEHMHTPRESSHRSDEATDLGIEHPALDQEAIARLAYFYWVRMLGFSVAAELADAHA